MLCLKTAWASPKDGFTEGKACRTSSRLLLGPPTQSLKSALPSGLARCRSLAASLSSDAEAAKAGKQDLCAGAQRSVYFARADCRLTGPAAHQQRLMTALLDSDDLHSFGAEAAKAGK